MTWNSTASMKNPVPVEGSQTSRIAEAMQTLEKAVEEDDGDTIFLWTGGKEAQVIADLLLYDIGEEKGKSPIPFGLIDTGNHFDEMYEFREEFMEASGDRGADTVGPFNGIGNDFIVERYEEFLENVIENESDPRGYHGEHAGEWKCPECGSEADLEKREKKVNCPSCGNSHKLGPIQRQNLEPEEYGVPESCGTLKVVPLKRFVEDHGFTRIITGIRSSDMIAGDEEEEEELEVREEKDEPANYTRINPLKNWSEANVWAYIKMESVSYPELYDQGYRHTDAECCTQDVEQQAREYGEGGVDQEKEAVKNELQDMGYI